MNIYTYSCLLLMLTMLFSCDAGADELCISNQQSVQIGLYSANTIDAPDTTLQNVTIFGINNMVPSDSLITDSAIVSKAFLPLNMFSDTTRYVMKIGNASDTISFIHRKNLSFISEECGFIFQFDVDTVLHTEYSFIDSVSINYPSVIYNENLENVKIYIY